MRSCRLPCAAALVVCCLLSRGASGEVPVAGEVFDVSVDPVAATPAPRMAAGPGGDSVALWVGDCDGGAGLCGRTYDALGEPVAGPFLLPVPVELAVETPPAVGVAGGDFFVFWTRAGLGFAREIAGRRFHPDGTAAGPERTVAAASGQVFARPDAAADASGRPVVVFERQRYEGVVGGSPAFTGVEIQARRLDGAGAPLGPAVLVHADSGDQVAQPRVGVGPAGGFLVAWESFALADTVRVRRFTPAAAGGATALGGEADVDPGAAGSSEPAVAASDQGTFLVAWERAGAGGPTAPRTAHGQVFGAAGPLFPAPFRLGSGAASQAAPAVSGGDGAFVAVWKDARADGSVYADRWSDAGVPLGAELRVDESAAGDPLHPSAAVLGGVGEGLGFLVGWTRQADDSSRRVLARRFAPAEAPPQPCVPSATVLCLGAGDRFRVTTQWAVPGGGAGQGVARELTGDTGWFWFFDEHNVEVVVKVLAACPVNGRFWVFAAGLTNVSVQLDVEDTVTGVHHPYTNPPNTPFEPVQDTAAFPCP